MLRAMDARQIKLTLKSAYRKDGKKVKKIVEQVAATATTASGPLAGRVLKHGADGKEVLAIARGKLMQSGMAHA